MNDDAEPQSASQESAAPVRTTGMGRITADRPLVVLTVDESSPSASTLSLDPLAAILESIEEGVVLMRSDMYPCYSNSAAERLLSTDADRAVLTRELRSLSRAALVATEPHAAEIEVGTKTGCYRLRATLLKERIKEIASRAVLVTIDRAEATLPSRDFVMRRFGMTAREANVALLLARGARNARVATELRISTHTARHHTERVLAKLNVHGRGEVARAILAGAAPQDESER